MMKAAGQILISAWIAGSALALPTACKPHATPDQHLPKREPFIALERDFQDFEAWTPVDLSIRPALSSRHEGGDPHEYINQLPPHDSKAFPIGTILVKTVTNAPQKKDEKAPGKPQPPDIFAMVKRGGGYNEGGTPGWEWLELRRRDDGSFGIVWRGVNPPAGGGYGSDKEGPCNSCHQMALKNDYVHAAALSLSKI